MLLSACAGESHSVLAGGDRYVGDRAQLGELSDVYRLGIGDKIRMIVFNEKDLSGEFLVNSAGEVALPLIGDVKAIGLTTQELAQVAQQKFGDGYLRSPRVSIDMLTFRPFFILGEVKTPSQYPFATAMTAVNAIATAGGFTPRADKRVVYIRKSGSETEQAYRLTPDLRILPGDTVRIGERIF